MDLEASVRAWALLDDSITADIGERWFVDFIPDEATYPLVKMSQITAPNRHSHQGNSGRVALLQCDIYAETKAACNATAQLIINRFDSYKGMIGDIKAGYVWAYDVRGEWVQSIRKFVRVVELEIATND